MQRAETLEKLRREDAERMCLGNAVSILHWDMETYMPPAGVEERSEQLALLESIAHERLVAPETGRLLAELGSTTETPRGDESLPDQDRDLLRAVRRAYDKATKLPGEFVAEEARAQGLSQAAWAQARRANDFAAFLPHLETMIGIARKKAELWGFGPGSPRGGLYDGLIDSFEPGMSASEIAPLFAVLRERLSALLREVGRRGPPDVSFLQGDFPVDKQEAFCRKTLGYLGFDARRGRMDTSAHPFATSLGADDVRITTRYAADNLLSSVLAVVHEFGHARYEMGFPKELRGSSLASCASYAIHESQSRLWENVIGRSRPFWNGLFPSLRDAFPDRLRGATAESFYLAATEAKPSLIRVDADEVSYGLHIIMRFELEQALISGDLPPARLPDAWREKTSELLGIDVDPSGPRAHADGSLQDVHWSMGAFGYFPSYALGDLYGLHFFRKIRRDIPDLAALVESGNFAPLHDWLRDNVHAWGARLEPAALLEKVAGEKLGVEPFLEYIEGKYGAPGGDAF